MKTKKDFHHIFPKCRGGTRAKKNLLMIKIDRHVAWHKLWNMRLPNGKTEPRTLSEIIFLLENIKHFKASPPWIIMWGNRTLYDVIELLKRVKRAKKNQHNYVWN